MRVFVRLCVKFREILGTFTEEYQNVELVSEEMANKMKQLIQKSTALYYPNFSSTVYNAALNIHSDSIMNLHHLCVPNMNLDQRSSFLNIAEPVNPEQLYRHCLLYNADYYSKWKWNNILFKLKNYIFYKDSKFLSNLLYRRFNKALIAKMNLHLASYFEQDKDIEPIQDYLITEALHKIDYKSEFQSNSNHLNDKNVWTVIDSYLFEQPILCKCASVAFGCQEPNLMDVEVYIGWQPCDYIIDPPSSRNIFLMSAFSSHKLPNSTNKLGPLILENAKGIAFGRNFWCDLITNDEIALSKLRKVNTKLYVCCLK